MNGLGCYEEVFVFVMEVSEDMLEFVVVRWVFSELIEVVMRMCSMEIVEDVFVWFVDYVDGIDFEWVFGMFVWGCVLLSNGDAEFFYCEVIVCLGWICLCLEIVCVCLLYGEWLCCENWCVDVCE